MPVEIIPASHHLVLEETAPELAPGDAVAFTIVVWEGGEQEIKGEVVRSTAPGQWKIRTGDTAVIVPAQACRLVYRAAERRAA